MVNWKYKISIIYFYMKHDFVSASVIELFADSFYHM